jgi:hypothetical protein
MISTSELRSALDAAHDYYYSTFFGLKTKTTKQEADMAMDVLNKFKENGQQLYDKEYWRLGINDSICASVGHLQAKWKEIERYSKLNFYKNEQKILSEMD